MIEYKSPVHGQIDARDTITLNELGITPFSPVSAESRLRPGTAISTVAAGSAAGGR